MLMAYELAAASFTCYILKWLVVVIKNQGRRPREKNYTAGGATDQTARTEFYI